MNKPLLIRLGTAFNPQNHNSIAEAIFIKNYSLCNPCFAINKEMAIVYLYYLQIIDYHSDIYFHRKIPSNVPGVQYFTMYPYPVYELSFVKEKQKFESLVRPVNAYRRIEYKEYLILTTNLLLNPLIKNIVSKNNLNISFDKIGYHGNINSYVLMDEYEKGKYYFEYKFIICDDIEYDIKIIEATLNKQNNKSTYQSTYQSNDKILNIYKPYIDKINELYNISINFEETNLSEQVHIYYNYLLKLYDSNDIIKININNKDDILLLNNYIKFNNSNLEYYNKNKFDFIQ
jgi:hypothetical protein